MLTNTNQAYFGDSYIKAQVLENTNSEVNLSNKNNCNFSLISGNPYTISFYLKGIPGKTFKVSLMNGESVIASENDTTKLSEWTYYTFMFSSNVDSSSGSIKIEFQEKGVYYIDEIALNTSNVNKWYVSDSIGFNSNNGQSESSPFKTIQKAVEVWNTGDIILVMNGIYRNNGFGNGSKDNGPIVQLSKEGTLNGPMVIRNYPGHSPKLEFDGSGGFVVNTGKYLEISGMEIQGQAQQITYEEANSYRLIQNNYYKGRGITVWAGNGNEEKGGHHITIHSNKVYDCPGSGIRINNSDYCIFSNNEVYNCTRWTSSGSSALVFAQSKSYDLQDKIKMRITNNRVYDNVNEIRYFNQNYACPDPSSYGCQNYPNIIDGSGCYITRNNDRGSGAYDENPNGQYTGYFYFANNVSYGNGINGLVVHKSDNSIVMNNTIFKNGAVPLSEGRQSAAGITVNNSFNVRVYNNISWTRFDNDYGYKVFGGAGSSGNIKGTNNMLVNGLKGAGGITGMVSGNPNFVNENNYDFHLNENSPAIDAGLEDNNYFQSIKLTNTSYDDYTPETDIDNNLRGLNITDIGAYEWTNFPPIISLIGDSTINIVIDSDYQDQGATANDNEDGDLTNNIEVNGLVDTSTLGTYTLTYNVSDSNNYPASEIIRTVNVVEGNIPSINLIGEPIINLNVGSNYEELGATAVDLEDGDLTENIVISGNVNTSLIGTYQITYNVTDSEGSNASEVIRTVNIIDITPPVITLIQGETLNVVIGSSFTNEGATASDNVDGDLTSSIIVSEAVNTSIIGTYQIIYTVTDSSGNQAEDVIQIINVVDPNPPVIDLNGQQAINIELGNDYNDEGATANDNEDGDITSNIIISGTVNTSILGTYNINYNVEDSSGNNALELIRVINVVLSEDNFSLSKSEKCVGTNSISIASARSDLDYTVTVSGAISQTTSFSGSSYEIENLSGGTYSVCLTVDGVAASVYQRCYTMTITEPQPLSVYSITDPGNNSVTFNLEGGTVYNITHNGMTTQTRESTYTVSLKAGMNTIDINTGIGCQGEFGTTYFNSSPVDLAPNPFKSSVKLYVGGDDEAVSVSVFNMTGHQVLTMDKVLEFGSRTLEINTTSLMAGTYLIKINGATTKQTFVAIKQ